jgi:beta-lactamase regulating signal transducer with metallopeptidase domain
MLISLGTPLRSLLLAVVLAFAAHAVDARAAGQEQPQTTARSTARSKGEAAPTAPEGVPVDGVLIIIGIVGAVILLAWVCSRVGDSR